MNSLDSAYPDNAAVHTPDGILLPNGSLYYDPDSGVICTSTQFSQNGWAYRLDCEIPSSISSGVVLGRPSQREMVVNNAKGEVMVYLRGTRNTGRPKQMRLPRGPGMYYGDVNVEMYK
ncbi:MAG: hypothetical protein WBV73_23050 [Phormidium sp.]